MKKLDSIIFFHERTVEVKLSSGISYSVLSPAQQSKEWKIVIV